MVATKRPRTQQQAMHQAFADALPKMTQAAAIAMVAELTPTHVLGLMQLPRKGTLLDQIIGFKSLHPGRLVLVRVGELYECHGVDAAVMLEAWGSERSGKELRVCVSPHRLQSALNAALRAGYDVALFEESEVICTPRHRRLAQIVSAANPQYGVEEAVDTPSAKPIVGVCEHHDGSVDVCSLDLQSFLCRKMKGVALHDVRSILLNAAPPLYSLRRRPTFLSERVPAILLGGDPCADLGDRLIQKVCAEHQLDPARFRAVVAELDGCAPLTRFTRQQLGLMDQMGVPALVDCCLPANASRAVRAQLRAWLCAPPPAGEVAAIRDAVSRLVTRRTPLPTVVIVAQGAHERALRDGVATADVLRSVAANAAAAAELHAEFGLLFQAVSRELGLVPPTCEAFRAVADAVRARVADADRTETDARGIAFALTLRTHPSETAAAASALRVKNEALDALLAGVVEGELVRDGRGVAYRGRANGSDRLPVHDRSNRIMPLQFTTFALRAAEEAVAAASRTLLDAEAAAVRACVDELAGLLPTIVVAEATLRRVETLREHARLVCGGGWCAAAAEGGDATSSCSPLVLEGLVPYWMLRDTAVLNRVELSVGTSTILTGPNGGGKTSMLRAIAAAALLHQCGLCVPCSRASIPRLDHVFLRSGSSDASMERQSSFATEMVDLRAIMEAPGRVLALVDEPCRGTATAEGMRLLGAIIEHLPTNVTALFSTHYHELESGAGTRRIQLGAEVVGDDCVPNYRLQEGTCRDSLAVRVALAVGLPIPIIRSARRADDVETLVLTSLAEYQIPFQKLPLDGGSLPPSFTSVVYVLDTIEGVYVGESDRFVDRLRAHQRTKPAIRSAYVAHVDNKTRARQWETALLREMRYHDITLLSDADARHSIV